MKNCSDKPDSRKAGWRDGAIALSLATLCFIQVWHELFFAGQQYYNKVPLLSTTVLALILNVTGLAFLLWLGAVAIRRSGSRWLHIAGSAALCVLLLIPLNFARFHFWGIKGGAVVGAVNTPLGFIVMAILAVAFLKWLRFFGRAGQVVVLVLAPVVILVFGHAGFRLATEQPRTVYAKEQVPARHIAPEPNKPRVVWIIFDELDQRIAFSERPPGIELPEMDRLRRESIYALNAFPPAGSTLLSIPSLTIGTPITAARPEGASELLLLRDGSTEQVRWSAQPNIFARAKSTGARTALVGWYHPYSRIFGDTLDYCKWYAFPPYEQGRDETFAGAAVNQLCAIVSPLQQRRLQIKLCRNATSDSLDLAADPNYQFVFLHLPLPHAPGIYDVSTGKFSYSTFSYKESYLGNLILMDHTFGKLREALESAGALKNTWIILSSDHWWRDSKSYDGKVDHRVPFLVRAPGPGHAAVYEPTLGTVVSGDLVMSMLRGEVTKGEEILSWLDENGAEFGTNFLTQLKKGSPMDLHGDHGH